MESVGPASTFELRNKRLPIPVRLATLKNLANDDKNIKGLRSNHFIHVSDAKDSSLAISTNQRAHKLVVENATNCHFQVHDSVVFSTQAIELIGCRNCVLLIDEVDVRTLNCFDVQDCIFRFTNEPTLLENTTFSWHGACFGNRIERVHIKPGTNPNQTILLPTVLLRDYEVGLDTSKVAPEEGNRKAYFTTRFVEGEILKNTKVVAEKIRTVEDVHEELQRAEESSLEFNKLTTKELDELFDDEIKEFNDEEDEMLQKVKWVAKAIQESKHVVIYTGAGVSTSAKIPDYRGPQGVWTQLRKGNLPDGKMNLSQALPTFAHYAMAELVKRKKVEYIISTNLDGLHRRSGVPANAISELHGNCYREICAKCKREYLRAFDTLTSRDDRWSHLTGRNCTAKGCGGPLKDTIIHFTENMPLQEMNMAMIHGRQADLALVVGTSMLVQPAASIPEKALLNKTGKLVIVNLQRTPFDDIASVKIHAKSDHFFELLMKELGYEDFDLTYDHVLHLKEEELRQEQLRADYESKRYYTVTAALIGLLAFVVWKYR
eukprot:TRINITY_DN5906_c0_g1_i3.p1 TRINITY_DN5906_c0_g1~~TRINITY_DN5906_c0_g1_i3.p1  ORF type:complete len:547 (-),score=122.31 TRINITY_DN5906_c0_g1_i3:40-1680(-)